MKHKIPTVVLAAMVVTCTALPHHPIFFANSPPRQGFLANRDVVYSPYYDNSGRYSLLSSPQFVSPGQLYLVPPSPAGINYVPIHQSQPPVPSKVVGLDSDHINFCKVVGNSLATSEPSSLLLETPLDLAGVAGSGPATMIKSSEGSDVPRRRQSVGPINLNYMCKRIARIPIPGQIGVHTLVRYCKRLAHTIASNVPFILREEPAWHGEQQVPQINFSGLYDHQKPLRAIPTEAYNIAMLCQTMLQQIVSNVEIAEVDLEAVDKDDSMNPVDETKPSTPAEQTKPAETAEPVEPMEPATTEVPMDAMQSTMEAAEPEESVMSEEPTEEVKADAEVTPDEEVKPDEDVTPNVTMEPMKEENIKPTEPAMSQAPMKPLQAVEPLIALDLSQLPVLPIDSGVPGLSGIKFLIKNPIPSHVRQFIIVSPPEGGLVQNSPADSFVVPQNQPQAAQQFVLHQTHG